MLRYFYGQSKMTFLSDFSQKPDNKKQAVAEHVQNQNGKHGTFEWVSHTPL